MYPQIYARNVDRNNSADGERDANADRGRADTAARETYCNPDTSRRDVTRDVLCVEILGYRHFLDLLRVRGS